MRAADEIPNHRFVSTSYALRIHAGPQALDALVGELRRAGVQRALVVCGRSVAAHTSLVANIKQLADGRVAGVYAGLGKDAPVESIYAAVQAARECAADGLIAVGAGSVLKGVRAVAILLAEAEPLDQLITRYPDDGPAISPSLMAAKLPIFNVLTAATSAQNRAGTALKGAGGLGRIELFDPKTRPRAIFWDSRALATAPPALALSTGFAVYWRALMNVAAVAQANPLVQASRLHAWRLAEAALPRVGQPEDDQARIDLCAAALLQNRDEDDGGRPMDSHWVARIVYALAAGVFHVLPEVGQGAAHAALTAGAIRGAGELCPQEMLALAVALGDDRPTDAAAWRSTLASNVEQRFAAFGLPTRLSTLGVSTLHFPAILALSLKNFNADRDRSFRSNPGLLERVLADAL